MPTCPRCDGPIVNGARVEQQDDGTWNLVSGIRGTYVCRSCAKDVMDE